MSDYTGGGAAFSTNWHGFEGIGDGSTIVNVDGAWTGTIFSEGRSGGGTVYPVNGTPVNGAQPRVTQLAAGEVGAWRIPSGGIQVRARFAPGTGNPTIRMNDAEPI